MLFSHSFLRTDILISYVFELWVTRYVKITMNNRQIDSIWSNVYLAVKTIYIVYPSLVSKEKNHDDFVFTLALINLTNNCYEIAIICLA